MANTKSAEKKVRQIKTRTERNKAVNTKVKSLRKKVVAAAEGGDQEESRKLFNEFSSAVDKAAKKNIYQKNKAANLKSRTNAAIKSA